MIRTVAATALAALLLGGPAGTPARRPVPDRPPPAAAAVDYRAPVPTPVHVVRAFRPPPDPYAAGHRGVDLAVRPGQAVRAAAAGVVGFAGDVAGRGVVAIEHADGIRTEYEPVTPAVAAGAAVARGQVIGHVHGTHGSCRPGHCLHWGARRDGGYLDPMSLLRPLAPVRLLPWTAQPS